MADVVLEQRVTNLEELMADLIEYTQLSQERIEAGFRLHREEVEADLQAHREKVEADLQAHRESLQAEVQAHRESLQAEIRKSNRQWGEIANKMGTLTEDLVAPSLPRILRQVVACPEDELVSMAVRVRRAHPVQKGTMQEFDAIASCGSYALFNETKSRLSPADVDSLLTKLASARTFFAEYRDHNLIGSVATLYIDPSLVQYATRQGILALAVGDELMDIMNEPGFELKIF